MDAKRFFDEVAKLRELQRLYFKERSSYVLMAAKKQEKVVDGEIERVRRIQEKKKKELNLFNQL